MSFAETRKTFGIKRCDSKNLLTAEKLAGSWRSVVYPRVVSGERSYAFIGKYKKKIFRLFISLFFNLFFWFIYFWGPLAYLEEALLSYASSVVLKNGFKLVTVPDIVPQYVTAACGLQKRSGKDMQYHIVDSTGELCLSGTAGFYSYNFHYKSIYRMF